MTKNDFYVIQEFRAQVGQRSKVKEMVGVSYFDTHCTKSHFQFLTSQQFHSAFSASSQLYPIEGLFLNPVILSSFMDSLQSSHSIALPISQSNDTV